MPTVIHWFRKGIRIHDNPGLIHAINEAIKTKSKLRPLYIIDPKLFKWLRVGPNRWQCFQQHLQQLDENLRSVGSRLYIARGVPAEVFERIFPEWKVNFLTFEYDTQSYARIRDAQMEKIATKHGVKVISYSTHTLYQTHLVIKKNNGKAPLTYQKFLSVVASMPPPDQPVDAPKHIPDSLKPDLDSEEKKDPKCYDVPTIQELFGLIDLKMKESEINGCKFPGGENEALKRLNKVLERTNWICKFEKPNTSPNSLEPSTTVLSPYLKFGSLSCRLFYWGIQKAIKGKAHSKPPTSLIGQLMWREFYYTASVDVANFDKMVGNPICCQIPWDTNEKYLKAWTYGQTGYPFIDAIMRQLRLEGWIHHLARHAVACFLTRGDLWISWEEGLKVFEELLLDADWALNAGNWMWLSASAFFHQFYRVYSPVAFGKKTDPSGDYIKKYVPELKKYPVEYIYEPWKAPLSVQNAAKCVIGKDYPKRIVIHEDVYKLNIAKMSAAYKNNKAGIEAGKRESSASSSKEPATKKAKTGKEKGKSQTKLTKFLKK